MFNNDSFMDAVNILSLMVGLQNLQENREQSAQNNVHAENDAQAKYLLTELTKQFEEQNKLLNKIILLLEKGTNNGQRKADL